MKNPCTVDESTKNFNHKRNIIAFVSNQLVIFETSKFKKFCYSKLKKIFKKENFLFKMRSRKRLFLDYFKYLLKREHKMAMEPYISRTDPSIRLGDEWFWARFAFLIDICLRKSIDTFCSVLIKDIRYHDVTNLRLYQEWFSMAAEHA